MRTLEVGPILTRNSDWGKGVLTSKKEVLAYPDIPDMAHEFATLLQFGTTFELMKSMETQQIKVSQCMAEEHALTQTTESNDEDPLDKLG